MCGGLDGDGILTTGEGSGHDELLVFDCDAVEVVLWSADQDRLSLGIPCAQRGSSAGKGRLLVLPAHAVCVDLKQRAAQVVLVGGGAAGSAVQVEDVLAVGGAVRQDHAPTVAAPLQARVGIQTREVERAGQRLIGAEQAQGDAHIGAKGASPQEALALLRGQRVWVEGYAQRAAAQPDPYCLIPTWQPSSPLCFGVRPVATAADVIVIPGVCREAEAGPVQGERAIVSDIVRLVARRKNTTHPNQLEADRCGEESADPQGRGQQAPTAHSASPHASDVLPAIGCRQRHRAQSGEAHQQPGLQGPVLQPEDRGEHAAADDQQP